MLNQQRCSTSKLLGAADPLIFALPEPFSDLTPDLLMEVNLKPSLTGLRGSASALKPGGRRLLTEEAASPWPQISLSAVRVLGAGSERRGRG